MFYGWYLFSIFCVVMFVYEVQILCIIDWFKYQDSMLYWCFKTDVAATNAISVLYVNHLRLAYQNEGIGLTINKSNKSTVGSFNAIHKLWRKVMVSLGYFANSGKSELASFAKVT